MYLKMMSIVKYFMPVALVVMIILFWNFNSLVSESKELYSDSIELISLGNGMLNTNDYLIKLMRIYVVTGNESVLNEYESILNDYDSLDGKLDRMTAVGLSENELRSIDIILDILDELAEIEDGAIEAMQRGDNELAVSIIFSDEYSGVDSDLARHTMTLIGDINARTSVEIRNRQARETAMLIALIILVISSGVVTMLIIFWVVRKVFWYDKNLNNIIDKLTVSVSAMDASANRFGEVTESLAAGASKQADALEETSAAMNETASIAEKNAESTGIAAQLAAETARAGNESKKYIMKLIETMKELNESSDKMSRIVRTINDIAFQTNLLAINATVEAARAGGDAGRSFAVVAGEVRNLARDSAAAVTDTVDIIEKNIFLTKSSGKSAKQALSISTGDLQRTEKLSLLISEISSATAEQSRGIQNITGAIGEMERVTHDNATIAAENSTSSANMKEEMNSLNETITIARSLISGGKNKGGG
ncbi:MAG: methyl-accepting chemotaxis protein [Oscillospiraceae bacterium]|nr:methyl-accepting chemotaxis protein [Oscillospiraceae bacterium]